jgi:hypothetical protein
MTPSKCNFIVFSLNKKNDDHENIDNKLFGNHWFQAAIRLKSNQSIKNQIQYIKAACIKRLNVLKILSYKKWGLSKTLTEIYKSLIRSLLESSSIIYP